MQESQSQWGYYIHKDGDPAQPEDFQDDAQATILYLSGLGQPTGEIYLKCDPEIKIHYNFDTSFVTIVSNNNNPYIKNVYNDNSYQHILAPLEKAMQTVAKYNFLKALAGKADDEISAVIEANLAKVFHASHPAQTEKKSLFSFFKSAPVANEKKQAADLTDALNKLGVEIETVNSNADVKKMLDQLSEFLEQPKNQSTNRRKLG